MTPRTCSVDECTFDVSKGGKGLCGMHYARVSRGNDRGQAGYLRAPNRTAAERIYPRLAEVGPDGCWQWTGALNGVGYGVIGMGPRLAYVHRWVFEDLVAAIPKGLVIDHLCLNRARANPAHLDPVTRAVNNARGGLRHGERRSA